MATQIEIVQQLSTMTSRGALQAARELAAESLVKFPDDGRLWEIAGLLDHAKGDPDSCERRLETAQTLTPLRPAASCGLADAYRHFGRNALAKDLYAHVVTLDQSSIRLWQYCALRLDEIGAVAQAVDAARRVAAAQPENAQSIFEFGYYLSRFGTASQLVAAVMKQAISLAPDQVSYRLGLADLLLSTGDRSAAFAWIQGLSARQIEQLTCPCCLERLARLFESGNDWVRAHACRVWIDRHSVNERPTARFSSSFLIQEYLLETDGLRQATSAAALRA
ncbi:tetratricopeptide repeat protein [Schlesneria paludicola]|uniref:tetratricopeptide repeat protein n=1 Tax=Schlesneria paludicola TaxID=360056 RepID=UPI000299D98C|nr:hypothetical protein [Schlesneria paludicola]